MDPSPDDEFYSTPRFVTHIDDAAIERLREYYHWNLLRVPKSEEGDGQGKRKGGTRILDLCASWVSHFPSSLETTAVSTAKKQAGGKTSEHSMAGEAANGEGGEAETLEVVGLGMNRAELDANPIFSHRIIQDLNTSPHISLPSSSHTNPDNELDATACVVSIDYLTSPITVLRSILTHTHSGGSIHLVISNRCFPTKVAGEWLRLGEEERLELVGRYLWWSGWEGVEVVDLCAKREGGLVERVFGGGDPLWVVRGVKGGGDGDGGRVGRTEL
ncbi:MAG: hypothetical protein Q9221_007049 [Calogaya cf. arnoldii]